jgi:hypothetical protein
MLCSLFGLSDALFEGITDSAKGFGFIICTRFGAAGGGSFGSAALTLLLGHESLIRLHRKSTPFS